MIKDFLKNKLITILILIVISVAGYGLADNLSNEELIIATWNIRGYPEKSGISRKWFSNKLLELKPDIICIQEIANKEKVDYFLTNEDFSNVAFLDSKDGQDNAIFTTKRIEIEDVADPEGFQHPAQASYVSYKGFDAVIVTVHLSWTNLSMREREKKVLKKVVLEMLKKDLDVIIAGDFNTKEQGIEELAEAIGMTVIIPKGQEGIGTTHAGNRYDHFLISKDLVDEEAIESSIITFTGNDLKIAKKVSDHLPVIARFKTDEEFRDRGRGEFIRLLKEVNY